MKKTFSLLLALLLCAAATLPTNAWDVGEEGDGVAGTNFTLFVEEDNSPTYTITIPDSVTLDKNGADVAIKASDVDNLDGRRVSVQFGGTQFTDNQLVLQNSTQGSYSIVLYALKSPGGQTLVDTRANGNTGDNLIGTELASFSGNGSASYRVELLTGQFDPVPVAGVEYYGSVTYNIALVD